MRNLNLPGFLVFLILFSLSAFSQDKEKVIELMRIQEKAWNEGNIEGFMGSYDQSDSLLFIGSKGITRGWKNTLERYKQNYPDKKTMGELEFTIVKTEQYAKDCIYVIGKWNLKKEKPASGHFTLIWRKKNGEWKITSDHSS